MLKKRPKHTELGLLSSVDELELQPKHISISKKPLNVNISFCVLMYQLSPWP